MSLPIKEGGDKRIKDVQNPLESDHTRSPDLSSVIWLTRQPAKKGTGNLVELRWVYGEEKGKAFHIAKTKIRISEWLCNNLRTMKC